MPRPKTDKVILKDHIGTHPKEEADPASSMEDKEIPKAITNGKVFYGRPDTVSYDRSVGSTTITMTGDVVIRPP